LRAPLTEKGKQAQYNGQHLPGDNQQACEGRANPMHFAHEGQDDHADYGTTQYYLQISAPALVWRLALRLSD
jgi:hypothetical protein